MITMEMVGKVKPLGISGQQIEYRFEASKLK